MKLIGLNGNMGCGKTTVCHIISDFSRIPIIKSKFAMPLYDMQEKLYEIISPVYTRPKDFVKDRKLLQFLGTDWGREVVGPNIWVDLWKGHLKTVMLNMDEMGISDYIVTVDDIRFDNEAVAVKELGGILLNINRIKEKKVVGAEFSGHKSENGIDFKYVDYVIDNNGTIDELREALLTLNSKCWLW
jgi:hypothetical protein